MITDVDYRGVGKTRSGKRFSKNAFEKSKEIKKNIEYISDSIMMYNDYEKKIHFEKLVIAESEKKIEKYRANQRNIVDKKMRKDIDEIQRQNEFTYQFGKRKYDKQNFEIGDRVINISEGVNGGNYGIIVKVTDTNISVKYESNDSKEKRPKGSSKKNFNIVPHLSS